MELILTTLPLYIYLPSYLISVSVKSLNDPYDNTDL